MSNLSAPPKPILRVGKIKRVGRSTPSSVAGHLSRERHTPSADPDAIPPQWLIGGADLPQRIDAIFAKAKIDKGSLRKDATIANDLLLTVSPQWFRPDEPEQWGKYEPAKLEVFKREATEFLKEHFGARLAGAVLHLDEATPHVQAVLVPVMRKPNGGFRLSGKDLFNPQSLERFQQAWEDRMTPHGVAPREKGSKTRHVTLKAFYGSVEASPEVPDIVPSPPPQKPLLEGSQAAQTRVEEWQEAESQKIRKKLKPLAAAAAQGALFEAERRTSAALRTEIGQGHKDVAWLREEVARLDTELEIAKDHIAKLRGANVNQVALALGYDGPIGKQNAIDLVKEFGGLTYKEAIAWLHHSFGPNTAAVAVAKDARDQLAASPPPAVQTKPEQIKAKAIAAQLGALQSPAYRITIMRKIGEKNVGKNLGKSALEGQAERLFSQAEVIAMIPRLTAENASGGNVFITPKDPGAKHLLIDDLKAQDLDDLRSKGYRPATVVETSPGNCQVILKVDARLDGHAMNEFLKALNREHGDPKLNGPEHPFRLAGFQNRKEKYAQENGHFPFVRLVEATGVFCSKARAVIIEMSKVIADGLGSAERGPFAVCEARGRLAMRQ